LTNFIRFYKLLYPEAEEVKPRAIKVEAKAKPGEIKAKETKEVKS
jgi:hypothetical protein